MVFVGSDDITEDSGINPIVLASDLGITPDCFPHEIETCLGNGLKFIRLSSKEETAAQGFAEYGQLAGCTVLRVFNT